MYKYLNSTKPLFLGLIILLSFHSCKNKDVSPDTQVIGENIPKFTPNKDMIAMIYTSKGIIKVGLEFVRAPLTVANFVSLAEGQMPNVHKSIGKPFYDGMLFHRVMPQFMIQGGDPSSNGTGNAGYQFDDEFHPELRHDDAGVLSMANSGPGTNSCQFFITHNSTPWLDNVHTVFGKVIEGQEIVNKIVKGDRIDSIRIVRNTAEAKNFDAQLVFQSQKEIIKEKIRQEQTSQYSQYQNTPIYKAFEEYVKKAYPQASKTPSGLYYIKHNTTEELQAVAGNVVKVHYRGMLTSKKIFDESYSRGKPLEFQLGKQMVIPGWDEGIALLRKGEKATLIIPSYLAYGEAGIQDPNGGPSPIGPNETLIFDLELVSIK